MFGAGAKMVLQNMLLPMASGAPWNRPSIVGRRAAYSAAFLSSSASILPGASHSFATAVIGVRSQPIVATKCAAFAFVVSNSRPAVASCVSANNGTRREVSRPVAFMMSAICSDWPKVPALSVGWSTITMNFALCP